MKIKRLAISGLMAVTAGFSNVTLASIVNGGFDTDLSAWNVVTDGGSVNWSNGTAVLTTGDTESNASAVLVQGDDGSFSFVSPIHIAAGDELLKFDAVLSSVLNPVESGSSSFTDNLQVWLYDANNSSGNYFLTSIAASTGLTSYALDVSAYSGFDVALSFELKNYNDGFTTIASLDNIAFSTVSAVPLPNAFYLFAAGLVALSTNKSRSSKKVQ